MSDLPQLQPLDKYNRKLESNVHPSDWQNPVAEGTYNIVVIGGGTAGLVTAAGAAGLGAKVALIERDLLGGDCLNVGCVPSKAIIAAARRAAQVRDAGEFGVNVPDGVTMDFGKAMERMRKLRADISPHDSAARFRDLGIDLFLGGGKFLDASTIEVAGQQLKFKKACIATGARASAPSIPGLQDVDYLTNETLFSLTELPQRLGIIGAGPIGCEMAQSFARFGSEVFLVESSGGILPREDHDAARIVQESLKRDGVRILCCGRELQLSRADDGKVRLAVDADGSGYVEVVDKLLVAVGRAPNVEGLGLEDAGVEFTKKGVVVNDRQQTTNPNVYAAGDICSPYQFTHAADFMARNVLRNALFMGRAKSSAMVIPWATYTEPEIAHVGIYEKDAAEKGIEIDTFTQELSGVDRAILSGETEGFVRVHVEKGTDKIVGATVVGSNAGDMIGELTLAMTNGLGLGKIANTIHPYPTVAEAIRKVGDLYNKTRLTPRVQGIMSKWLAWLRR
ncbi:MAG: pyruvate/2-oxoglutarate dehydrogenase complex dihydrolipoamide dehydrogenase (E3) component [Verrucomicrobiales bacterium]|jgi:pyruvate/2-oxoglutarate dehydrogenase complex dihydrolipoamide dehydrogenase (E3) component